MGNNSHLHWDTQSEIQFIAGCGTGKWSRSSSLGAIPRRTILVNLREAYALRTDWNGIDKSRVLDYLDAQIRGEK